MSYSNLLPPKRPTPAWILEAIDAMRDMPGGPATALYDAPVIIGADLLAEGERAGWAVRDADDRIVFKRVAGLPLALYPHAREP